MKRFVFTLIYILLVQVSAYSQTVSAPEPKSFTQSTNGQDASGFVLSGFGSTATLLASISLVNPPSGTTFNLGITTGLTAASRMFSENVTAIHIGPRWGRIKY